ncbi:hypothetical protein ASE01_20120 [Nocardioides sp. Root190]|uniref:hypothetical protein n=1 Tax=Nocardioides sp. Root190 TaxID=1736488 RepID=UPI0006F3842E|nr:hypothetical protein [Nocardioides sp. Root190]KRB73084.1 hypothetical protein ASE01_20120 [Nocardioides sp. Root190]
MTLPAGVQTRTVTIAVPIDVLGGSAKAYSGTVKTDRPLVWAATGEPIWPVPAKLPAPVDGLITFEAPVVDQPGLLDASGAPITNWSCQVTMSGTWTGALRSRSRRFQIVEADVSPVALDVLLDAGVNPPVAEPNPYVKSIAGVTDVVTGVQLANAMAARLDAGDSSFSDALSDAVAGEIEGHEAGIDLGTANRTTSVPPMTSTATSVAAAAAISGLSRTVTGKGRSVDVEFYAPIVYNSGAANVGVSCMIVRDNNPASTDNQIGTRFSPATNNGPDMYIRRRTGILLDGVEYTFTVRMWTPSGTAVIVPGGNYPAQLMVTAV